MSPSKVLVFVSSAIIAGVVLGSFVSFSWVLFFLLFLAGIVFLILSSRVSSFKVFLFGLIILFILFGFLRSAFSFLRPPIEGPLVFSSFRETLVSRIGDVLGGQEAAMFSAMVLGEKGGLLQETKEFFNSTGTSHILAISGLHLAIVATLIYQVLIGVGFWRRQALWLAMLGIFSFVFLVGSPPSALRAGIMAGLYLFATYVGRMSQAWRLLLVAGVLMLLVSPQLLLFSVGFQLSFLAVLGIIFFKDFFDNVFSFIPSSYLRSLISLSFAAQLTTWPIVAKNFGMIALVGPLANLVVVPLLPVIMVLGLGFVAFGWLNIILAKIFLWPAWVLLHFILSFITWLSRFTYASVELGSLSLLVIFLYYTLLMFFYKWLKRENNESFAV